MSNTYICCVCGGEFEKGQSDEDAQAELSRNFPGFTPDECEPCCDACYKKFIQ